MNKYPLCLLVAVLMVGCTNDRLNIIEHPRPGLSVNQDIFTEAELDCDIRLSDMYGGLEPDYPVAKCSRLLYPTEDSGNVDESCLYYTAGFGWEKCHSIVVYQDESLRLVNSMEELQELFAPIESSDEALSYALLTGPYSARFDREDYQDILACSIPQGEGPGFECGDVVTDTHVVESSDDYEVFLYRVLPPGDSCIILDPDNPARRWSCEVDALYIGVSRDGVVTDPAGGGLCNC